MITRTQNLLITALLLVLSYPSLSTSLASVSPGYKSIDVNKFTKGNLSFSEQHGEDDDIDDGSDKPTHREPPKDVPVYEVKPDFIVTAKMPDVPSSLPAYVIKHVDPTAIDPRREHVANVFNFSPVSGDVDKREDGSVSTMFGDENGRTIEYFSSGAVFYMEEELFQEGASDILNAQGLSRESAKKYYYAKSKAFIEKNDLHASGMVFKDISFAEVKTLTVKSQEENVRVIAAAAHFGYEFDGIPAWGPGAKTTVYFGPHGIAGYYDAAPSAQSTGKFETIHPEKTISEYIEMGKPQTLLRLHAGLVEQVVIEEIQLVYYIDAGNKNQELITPHYLISGMFYGRDIADRAVGETEAEFQWLAPAVHLN